MALARVTITAHRRYANATDSVIRQAILAAAVSAGDLGGWYFGPLVLPRCFDYSRPSTLTWLITRQSGSSNALTVLNWYVVLSRLTATTSPADVTTYWDTEVPINWPINVPVLVTADEGYGYTWPAHAFTQDDLFGFKIARMPGDPTERFPAGILIPQAVTLTYTSLCRLPCCI